MADSTEESVRRRTPGTQASSTSPASPPSSSSPSSPSFLLSILSLLLLLPPSSSASSPSTSSAHIKGSHSFGGWLGCLFCLVFLPSYTILLYLLCPSPDLCLSYHDCLSSSFLSKWRSSSLPSLLHFSSWFRLDAFLIALAWYSFQALLYFLLPGEVVEGREVRGLDSRNPQQSIGGWKLHYRMNGHLQFWVSLFLLLCCYPIWREGGEGESSMIMGFTSFPLHKLFDMYLPLLISTILISFLFSLFLYLSSFRLSSPSSKSCTVLSTCGVGGGVSEEFFMGRELNPRLGLLDVKVYLDLRAGLITWTAVNIAACQKHFLLLSEGTVEGGVNWSLLLLTICQGVYCIDALINEACILSTMDITTDGCGFMLVFGNITWVPMVYSLCTVYVLYDNPHIGTVGLILGASLFLLGYLVFRKSNLQKDTFRRDPQDPSVRHLKTMKTKRGTELLISGWWGMARKVNFLGDILMALSYSWLCGTSSPVGHLFFPYLTTLLLHRLYRDDLECQAKYGADWTKYKQLVPYLLIPKVL